MAQHMSSDLPVIILLLGATIVPWLLWAFSGSRRAPDTEDMQPEPTEAPVSRAR